MKVIHFIAGNTNLVEVRRSNMRRARKQPLAKHGAIAESLKKST
jgi:hypothetical protein